MARLFQAFYALNHLLLLFASRAVNVLIAFRWEDGLADRVEYDSDGNIKTQIVKSPFVQVILL